MIFLINKLFEFIDGPIPCKDELINTFTKMAFEVESVKSANKIDGVKIGKVMECSKHPNADKLSYCKVLTDEVLYDVICGGENIKEGQTVIHAIPGSKVGDIKMEPKEIRGIVSNGMVLSISEIGDFNRTLVEDINSGNIVVLDEENKSLKPAQSVGLDTNIFDLSILPDRSYANSYISMANELAAFLKKDFIEPKLNYEKNDLIIDDEPEENTAIFKVKHSKGISSNNIKNILYFSEIKPLNEISDVVKYVEILTSIKVNINDELVTLSVDKNLKGSIKENLMFAVNIFINSAFESNFITEFSDVKINLINQTKKEIDFDETYANNYIGQKIDFKKHFNILEKLGFEYKENKVIIPSYRNDIEGIQHIIEEFLRVYGIENIVEKEIVNIQKNNIEEKHKEYLYKIVNEFVKFGFNEVKTYQLVSEEDSDKFNLNGIDNRIKLNKEYNFEYNTMQTSLLKGLIESHVYNYRKGREDIRLFELSNIFYDDNEPVYSLGIIHDSMINEKEPILATKKMIENAIEAIGFDKEKLSYEDSNNCLMNPYVNSKIKYNNEYIGVIGEIHPKILREFKYIRLDKVKEKLFYSEIRLEDINN